MPSIALTAPGSGSAFPPAMTRRLMLMFKQHIAPAVVLSAVLLIALSSTAGAIPDGGPTDSPVVWKQCANGRDDDRDGRADMLDPGCTTRSDTSEKNPPKQCANGRDDDRDGRVDLADHGCTDPETGSPRRDDNNEGDDPAAHVDMLWKDAEVRAKIQEAYDAMVDVEQGGWIYQSRDGKHLWPVRRNCGQGGCLPDRIVLDPPPIEQEHFIVGTFHTHPGKDSCEGPSLADVRNSQTRGVPTLILERTSSGAQRYDTYHDNPYVDENCTRSSDRGPRRRAIGLSGFQGYPGR
jgi:hypothetical protein